MIRPVGEETANMIEYLANFIARTESKYFFVLFLSSAILRPCLRCLSQNKMNTYWRSRYTVVCTGIKDRLWALDCFRRLYMLYYYRARFFRVSLCKALLYYLRHPHMVLIW